MKEKSVFDYTDYKLYVSAVLKKREWGEQARLARALNCQSAYLSQVLKAEAHLSPEQAFEVGVFFNHSKQANHYFLLLVQWARAGSRKLRAHLEEEIKCARENQLVLKKRLQIEAEVSSEDQAIVYSSWHYVAIHMAVLIPELRSIPAITEYLGLPPERVREVMHTLLRVGLVKESGGRYEAGPARVHLPHDSPLISKHHTNWRIQALASLDRSQHTDLHYSSVVTIARSDVEKVREILVRAIEEVRTTIRPSKDEILHAYCIDWFTLGSN